MDSKKLDAQSGHEFTLTAIIPALAGANMIYGVGMLDSALTWDYASAYLQNEFIDMVLKVVNGIQVSEKSLAMDVIRDVGPAGEFITHEHTYQSFKNLSHPELMNRDNRENWEAAGSPDIVDLAYEKSLEVLNTYEPKPRPQNVQKELDSIYAEYEQAIAERKAKKAAA
ncbi:MAG: trimethylamine methyltransferase family protein [Desulfobacterales bacterium]|nr:MAG: trimethylamine methyltransferase family protein [Desulfobacterales bacterium]